MADDGDTVATTSDEGTQPPFPNRAIPFVAVMNSLELDGLDLTRGRDFGRDVTHLIG